MQIFSPLQHSIPTFIAPPNPFFLFSIILKFSYSSEIFLAFLNVSSMLKSFTKITSWSILLKLLLKWDKISAKFSASFLNE